MPFNALGFFQRLFTFTTDRDNGTKIRADRMDAEFDNVKAAIDDITGDNYIHRGSIKAAQGLPANLSYTFNNDDDTGFYRPASDAISVQTGGAERARFTDAGLSVGGSRVLTQADEGAGKGLDADTLDGQEGAFYQNAANLNAGTISNARLPAVISSDITGNAATLDGKASAFYRNATNLNAGILPSERLVGRYDITAQNATQFGLAAPAFYRNASNLNAGTIPTGRLTGTYSINISGTAARFDPAIMQIGSGNELFWSNNVGNIDSLHYDDGTNTFTFRADSPPAEKTNPSASIIQAARLRLTSTSDASETSTLHGIQIGPTDGLNLIIDNNEIMVRNNGSPAPLYSLGGLTTTTNPTGTTGVGNRAFNDGRYVLRPYSGSSANNTVFPIGDSVLALPGVVINRNQSVNVTLNGARFYSINGSGTRLAGVWRSRGDTAGDGIVLTRTG